MSDTILWLGSHSISSTHAGSGIQTTSDENRGVVDIFFLQSPGPCCPAANGLGLFLLECSRCLIQSSGCEAIQYLLHMLEAASKLLLSWLRSPHNINWLRSHAISFTLSLGEQWFHGALTKDQCLITQKGSVGLWFLPSHVRTLLLQLANVPRVKPCDTWHLCSQHPLVQISPPHFFG